MMASGSLPSPEPPRDELTLGRIVAFKALLEETMSQYGDAIVCDYCDNVLAQGNRWFGNVKADLCDDCSLYLSTHPEARRDFTIALGEAG